MEMSYPCHDWMWYEIMTSAHLRIITEWCSMKTFLSHWVLRWGRSQSREVVDSEMRDIPLENKSIKSVLIKVWYQQNTFRELRKQVFSVVFPRENIKQQIVVNSSNFVLSNISLWTLLAPHMNARTRINPRYLHTRTGWYHCLKLDFFYWGKRGRRAPPLKEVGTPLKSILQSNGERLY